MFYFFLPKKHIFSFVSFHPPSPPVAAQEFIAVSDPEMEPHYECSLCGNQVLLARGSFGLVNFLVSLEKVEGLNWEVLFGFYWKAVYSVELIYINVNLPCRESPMGCFPT